MGVLGGKGALIGAQSLGFRTQPLLDQEVTSDREEKDDSYESKIARVTFHNSDPRAIGILI